MIEVREGGRVWTVPNIDALHAVAAARPDSLVEVWHDGRWVPFDRIYPIPYPSGI